MHDWAHSGTDEKHCEEASPAQAAVRMVEGLMVVEGPTVLCQRMCKVCWFLGSCLLCSRAVALGDVDSLTAYASKD